MNKNKEKIIVVTFSLPESVVRILHQLANKTGHKMSKIVEKGILEWDARNV